MYETRLFTVEIEALIGADISAETIKLALYRGVPDIDTEDAIHVEEDRSHA